MSMGEESLTEEEKETLANDIKINAASRQKELEKNTEKVNKGARFFFGFILMVFSLNSCNKGGGFFSFIIFCVGVYLTFPLLKNLKNRIKQIEYNWFKPINISKKFWTGF